MIGRRDVLGLIAGAGCVGAAPVPAQERMRRIALMMSVAESDPDFLRRIAVFRTELARLGWVEGRNLRLDIRWAGGDPAQAARNATELVALSPDLGLVNGNPTLLASRTAMKSVPVVFVMITDPVGLGFVPNLNRPAGLLTGFANYDFDNVGKWLETLISIAPAIDRAVFLHNAASASFGRFLSALEAAAVPRGIAVSAAPVIDAQGVDAGLERFAGTRTGLIVQPDLVTSTHRSRIVAAAARLHLPAVYPFRHFVDVGGLISLGVDIGDLYLKAAGYADRILRGEKPGDLPVQYPTKFEMVINLNTARALGLTVPPDLLARADEVIE